MDQSLPQHRRVSGPIELMIIILVIGILALISVAFLNTSRAKARDAKRLIDIRRVQTALEYYKLDTDGYPAVDRAVNLGLDVAKLCDAKSGSLVGAQTPCTTEYMTSFPTDPNTGKYYQYNANNAGYAIKFSTEQPSDAGAAGTYYAHSQNIDASSELK